MKKNSIVLSIISTYHFYLQGSKNDTRIEFQMISENNFENLRLLKKKQFEFEDQLYEDVDGFHALRKIVTIFFSIFLALSGSADLKNTFER